MKSFLLIGDDKAAYDYALSVSEQNNYRFIFLEAKDFPSFEKQFYTSTLEGNLCLFYLSNAQTLSAADSTKFLELVKDSPHKFLLSGTANVSWVLKKNCLVIKLDNAVPELTTQLQTLLMEKDRKAVRLLLDRADLNHLFHILKFGAWQRPESLEAMIKINQNLNKVGREYLKSLLAFVLPATPFNTYHKEKEVNPLEKSIKRKILSRYPQLTKAEVADAFLLMGVCKDHFSVDLTKEEKNFLGVVERTPEAEQAVFVANLEDYF